MADNNLARSRNDIPDVFAADDPLAELARIVGYDERLVPTPQAPVPAGLSAPRREPAFNLEDELLREFERYDSPSLDPANDLQAIRRAEPHHDVEPQLSEPYFDAAGVSDTSEQLAAPVVEDVVVPHSESWVDDEVRDPAGFDDQAVSAPAISAVSDQRHEPVFEQEPAEAPSFTGQDTIASSPVDGDGESWSQAESAPVEAIAPQDVPVAAETSGFDLADELESSIAPVAPPKKVGYVPGFRMPIANFNAASRQAPPAPEVEPRAPQPAPQVVAETAAELPRWDFVPPAPTGASVTWFAGQSGPKDPAVTVAPEVVAPATAPQAKFSPLDDLIYDVARFPAEQPAEPKDRQLPQELSRPDVAAVVVPAVAAAPSVVTPRMQDTPVVPTVVADPASAVADEAFFDPFADDEFELALDDLELDLADVVVAENSRSAAEPVIAPVAMAAQPSAAPEAMRAESVPVRAAPVMPVAPVVAEPVYEEAYDAGEPESDLPFDPSLISESEERPEAIADLDVPALPAEEPEQEPAYRPDYDIDIDAELATLLVAATPAAAAAAEPVRPVAAAAADGKKPDARPVYADLDEFERALEEDFRRSLATPLPAETYEDLSRYSDNAAQSQLRPASRNWVVPLAIVGVLALAGGGAYAWLGNGVSGMGSGEPVVIAADKEPIKVAPENPGGKTVPNQDKAVYDRVAGAPPETPKQQTLISSNEEPVDVVQKTLMPDNLPMDGEDDVEPTDVGLTQDPRLLPQQEQQASAGSQQDPVTVAPRKVKTMIVRPDGKLVEQEVTSPVPALVAQSEKMPAAPAKSVDVAALAEQPAPVAPALAQPKPAGIVPVSAPINAAPVAVEPTVAQPAPAAPATRAPVPAMRPAQQPVNVVAAVTDQGNVRPAQAPAAAPSAGTQVASLGDGGYVIQIASLPSQADAQKSYQNLSSKFGTVIGGRGVDIKAAEIAGKGTFYRVRIPAGSKAEAVSLCERYRSAGGTCLVAK